MPTYILFHSNCPDGFGAAYAAYLIYGNQAEYIPVSYGHPPPKMEPGSDVFIVDFSYPRPVLEDLSRKHHQLVILDHHVTAQKDLDGFCPPVGLCRFDMTRSGAVLAWEYFHPASPVPEFFLYLQDRDLWQFKYPKSREVSAALRSWPFDFGHWRYLDSPDGMERLKNEGVAILRLTAQMVDAMAVNARLAWFDLFDPGKPEIVFVENLNPVLERQYRVPVSNATVFFSEVGERLLELHPDSKFSAYYFDRKDGRRQWGMRSRPDFDCSVIAKAFGGGGHAQASGFVQTIQ